MLSRFLLIAALLVALFGVIAPLSAQHLPHVPARAKVCPLFLTLDDPAYCSLGISPSGLAATSRPAKFLADGSRLIALDQAILDSASPTPLLTSGPQQPFTYHPLGLTVIRSEATAWDNSGPVSVFRASNSMTASYDLPALEKIPLFSGLRVTTDSNMSKAADEFSAETKTNSATSRIGLTYEDRGVTIAVNPDVAFNWGDAIADETRFGLTNLISAQLAPDLTLTLISGYDSFSYSGDPLRNYNAMRNRIAVSYRYPGGTRIGAFARIRNEQAYDEDRTLIGPGLSVTAPLGTTLDLTTTTELNLTEREMRGDTDVSVSEDGHLHSFGLRLDWRPLALASRAVTIMAAYTVNYDSTLRDTDAESVQNLARLGLAMKF